MFRTAGLEFWNVCRCWFHLWFLVLDQSREDLERKAQWNQFIDREEEKKEISPVPVRIWIIQPFVKRMVVADLQSLVKHTHTQTHTHTGVKGKRTKRKI